jgi:outer membrane protein insertion porin family
VGSGKGRVDRILLAVALLAVCLPCVEGLAGSVEAQSVESPRIRRIVIKGNVGLSEDRLRAVMRHKQPASFIPFQKPKFLGKDVFAQDLLSILELYRQEGYPFARIIDPAVVYEDPPTRVRIEILLEEGPLVTVERVRFEGVEPEMVRGVEEAARLRPSAPLSQGVIHADVARIASFYAEKARPTTEIGARIEYLSDSLTADVVFEVSEGPTVSVRDVRVPESAGLRTRPYVIRQRLLLKSGDLLVRSRLLESQARLYRTGLFRSARILPKIDPASPRTADLDVLVSEKPPGWYGVGGGFSSSDEVRFVAEWGHLNLGGRWRVLQANGRLKYSLDETLGDAPLVLKEGFATLHYTEPFLLGSQTFSHTEIYYNFERERIFEQNLTGVIQSFRRDLPKQWRGNLSFELRFVETTDPASLRDSYRTHLVSLILDRDLRNNIFDPSQGHHYRFVTDYAGGFLGGKNRFFRNTATAGWYVTLKTGVVVACRVRGGLITPLGTGLSTTDSLEVSRVPCEDRYRAGGGTTVRGYKEETLGRRTDGQPLGGLVLFVSNLELRFPLVWRFQGALFMDAGNVWADPEELKLSRFREGIENGRHSPLAVAYSLGVGLRFRTPVGPLRLDYGVKVGRDPSPGESPEELHISLGQAF